MSNRAAALGEDDIARIVHGVLRLGRRLRAARPRDSTPLSALGLMATLNRSGAMTAAQLAQAEGLQPQSLSRLLSDLHARGLIERQTGAHDRRTLVLSLSEAGRRVLRDDMAARRIWLTQEMQKRLTPEEQALLLEASDLMIRLAES